MRGVSFLPRCQKEIELPPNAVQQVLTSDEIEPIQTTDGDPG